MEDYLKWQKAPINGTNLGYLYGSFIAKRKASFIGRPS